jgi:hypothetical protein
MLHNVGLQMATTYLPETDHVVRYVPWSRLRKDENDNVIGVLGVAFRLREGEDYLSATWAEFFNDSTHKARVSSAVKAIRASKVDVRPRSGFAIGNVGGVKSTCLADKRKHRIRVIHEAMDDNPAHAALRLWPHDNDALLDLLAEGEWSATVLNKDVP